MLYTLNFNVIYMFIYFLLQVNAAALLGFTVNAAERPNMGEIQSVRDTM